MTIGLVGIKCGMTRIFNKNGYAIPISIIKCEPNIISYIKNNKNDNYNAIQVTFGKYRLKKLSKSFLGYFYKFNINFKNSMLEFRIDNDKNSFTINQLLTVSIFEIGQKINITGISKGKGFQGTIKRWNFHTQDASHGNSLSHRVSGSIGQCQTPGRVLKGKKMAGRMGCKKKTIKNTKIINIDIKNNLILVQGSIPGFAGNYVILSKIKKI